MPPPKLTRDAPILDVFEPMAIGVFIFLGVEFDVVAHDRFQSQVGKVLHAKEPLRGEFRLDGHVGALREAHLVVIIFHLLHQSCSLEVFGYAAAHIHAIHAHIEAGRLADGAVVVENVDGRQAMLQSQGMVVDVVGRRHLQAASSKFHIHVIVFDDGNFAVHQRHNDVLAFQPRVFRIVGVDAHGRVAHDGLGARGGHNGIIALRILMDDVALVHALAIAFHHTIFQIIEFRMLFLVDNLLVGERRLCLWIPVHHAHAAVDESLVVEVAEHFYHPFAACLIHGEGGAIPIARATQLAQLFQNDATMLVCPVPRMF